MHAEVAPLPFDALDLSPAEVDRRFALARSRGTPRWLWPALPVERWMDGRREVVRATSAVLAGRKAALDEGDAVGAQALGIAAFTLGMGPLLGRWLEDGTLSAEPRTAAVFALHLAHGRARAEKLGRELDTALAALASGGVEATVLKGMHTARALFPEPGTRPMTDIDLVVDADAIPAAEAALRAAGYVRQSADYQRRPYHADWRPPGETGRVGSLVLAHRDNPLTLNLHDGFDRFPGPGRVHLGAPGPADLAPMPGTATPARALAGPFLVAYLAAHASEQRENLMLVRLVELVLAMRSGVRADDLRGFLAERRMAHNVYPALALAERLAPGTVEADFLGWLEAESGPRIRAAVAALDLAALQRLDQRVAGGRDLAARGTLDRLRAALRWVLPHASPRRIAAAYASRGRRLVHLLRAR
ncbi:MAG TPA: nucleotidyltransferase family protein [Longimicrobium sp.]|nr:nucleotidyltransferase family protein [Longimicrobium sp.]